MFFSFAHKVLGRLKVIMCSHDSSFHLKSSEFFMQRRHLAGFHEQYYTIVYYTSLYRAHGRLNYSRYAGVAEASLFIIRSSR